MTGNTGNSHSIDQALGERIHARIQERERGEEQALQRALAIYWDAVKAAVDGAGADAIDVDVLDRALVALELTRQDFADDCASLRNLRKIQGKANVEAARDRLRAARLAQAAAVKQVAELRRQADAIEQAADQESGVAVQAVADAERSRKHARSLEAQLCDRGYVPPGGDPRPPSLVQAARQVQRQQPPDDPRPKWGKPAGAPPTPNAAPNAAAGAATT